MKKTAIIGSLVAGAFLLPAIASAGVVSGQCVNCHTMHNSQNNATMGGGNTVLLRGAGCVGCHDEGTGLNTTGGTGGAFNAPQVADPGGIGAGSLSAGYFTATGDNGHNVLGISAVDGVFGATPVPPGGATAMTAQLDCVDCHDGSGTHHGTAGPYRMLSTVTGTGAGDYGYANGRQDNTYNATTMNAFCANCHATFHTGGQGSLGAWVRHPTDQSLSAIDTAMTTSRGYVADYSSAPAAKLNETPLGVSAAGNDTLMCLSCHYAHGSANPDLLAFDYTTIVAGGTQVTDRNGGCENCHNYGGFGY